MRRRAIAALLAASALFMSAGTVAAIKPIGTCSTPYAPITLQGLFETYPDVLAAYGEEALTGLFDFIDKNNNDTICHKGRPDQSTSFETHVKVATVVDDNTSSGGD